MRAASSATLMIVPMIGSWLRSKRSIVGSSVGARPGGGIGRRRAGAEGPVKGSPEGRHFALTAREDLATLDFRRHAVGRQDDRFRVTLP